MKKKLMLTHINQPLQEPTKTVEKIDIRKAMAKGKIHKAYAIEENRRELPQQDFDEDEDINTVPEEFLKVMSKLLTYIEKADRP
ncbi:MAG: hypothetical protein ACOYVK_17465 [Bacillota bacterium]